MSVNSAQSLIGMLAVVLWLSSCATSRRRAYDMRPENRAALYQERKLRPITEWTMSTRSLSIRHLIQ